MSEAYRRYLQKGEEIGGLYTLHPPLQKTSRLQGNQYKNRPGSSMEFQEHREYHPGDDLRRIDWGAYARSDKLMVKLYQQEVHPHLDLILDGSRSSNLEGSKKLEALLGLAAVLATAAKNASFSHRVWQTSDICQEVFGGKEQPSLWQQLSFHSSQNPLEAFRKQPPSWKVKGVRILLSDLLWPGEPLEFLRLLAAGGADVIVIQVLSKQDIEPPLHGNIRLVDSETQEIKEVYIDSIVQENYKRRIRLHQELWQQASRQSGITMATLVAEDVVQDWNLYELLLKKVLLV